MSKQIPLASPTLLQLTGFPSPQIHSLFTHLDSSVLSPGRSPCAPCSIFITLFPECSPAGWNFPIELFCFVLTIQCFLAAFGLTKLGQGWAALLGSWKLVAEPVRSCPKPWEPPHCLSCGVSGGWLLVWPLLPALLPRGKPTGSELEPSFLMEQWEDVCIVPMTASSHEVLLFAAFLLVLVL